MEYLTIRPAQVHLDPENPRLADGTSNDKEAINRLLVDGFDQLAALARDLVGTGQSNPAELPFVRKDGKKYVVLEGNRRFAALKLIENPFLADDAEHRSTFERIRDGGGRPPSSIYCVVVDSREEADHWITLRHTGANDGVGVRVWSSEQSARHRRRMHKPVEKGTDRSITIADELTEAYQVDPHLTALIAAVRAERLTNIGRFFSADVMTRLQLKIEADATLGSNVLLSRYDANNLHAFFVWSFGQLSNKTVDAFKNADLRARLLDSGGDQLPEPTAAREKYERVADTHFTPTLIASAPGADKASTDADPSSARGAGAGTGESQSDAKVAGVSAARGSKPQIKLYSKVRLPALEWNTRQLLTEAQHLRFDDNPATTCVLARVVLECAVSDPLVLRWAGTKESDSLDHKIRQCILKLDPDIEKPRKRTRSDLVQAWHEVSDIGVAYLHQFLHNPQVKRDQHLASRFSIAFSPLLNSIAEAVR